MIEVGAILAVLVITYGAIQIMLGGAMPSKIQQGRSAITGAIVGVILMLVSWLIINQVFYLLVVNNVTGKPWNQIDCPPEETLTASNGPGGVVLPGGSPPPGGGDSCADVNAAKAQLSGGGQICAGIGSCPTCDTSPWQTSIAKYSDIYNVPESLIKAIIAMESRCNPNAGSVDGLSCGLMQPIGACSLNPDTNIQQGTKVLADAYSSAKSLKSRYGNAATVEELTYAIYNAGIRQSGSSVDCKVSDGWPAIPKWGCPIRPGEGRYNACFIKGKACNFGKCF